MKLYNISLQSLRRRKSRTAFLIIGLLLAVASFVTLTIVSENVNKNVAESLDEFGANMIVTPKSSGLNLNYGGLTLTGLTFENGKLNQNDIDLIKTIKNKDNLSIIAPKLFSVEKINDRNVIVSGIDFTEAQSLFNKQGDLSLIEIAARCYDCPIEEIVRQTSEKLPGAKVTAIKQSIESKMTAIHRFEHFSLGISAVILVISLLIVFTNVNASVNERTKEIGIFMAVGFRGWHIIKIILLEVLIASFAAGVLGFFIGVAGAKIITPILSMNENIKINFSYALLVLSTGMAVVAGLLAGVRPALKAARLDPTAAFRSL